MSRVAVLGAGIAGLAAACHLRGQGHEVVVLERETVPGGRARRFEQDGFVFDAGPTVLTMVDLVDEALRAVGVRARDVLDLRRLDPAYRASFADGSTLHVRAGHEAMREEIARECGSVDAAAFDEFVDWLRQLYLIEMPHFIDTNYDSPADLLRSPRAAARLVRLGAFGRLGPQIRRRFRDDRLHRLFSFQAMYAGLAPERALALYAVITYMDSVEGVWFPRGGMRAMPEVLAQAAEAAGVEFRYGTTVERILKRSDGAVAGVATDAGDPVWADAVVVTLDVPTAYETLLPDLSPPRALRRPDHAPSALVWHLGVRGVPAREGVRGVPAPEGVRGVPAPEGVRGVPVEGSRPAAPTQESLRDRPAERDAPGVAHHNIHFGRAWESAFEDLLEHGRRMRDPSRLVTVPSLDDDSAAPAGHSVLSVLEPVPNLEVGRVDWSEEAPRAREELLGFLDGAGYPTDIVTERLVTPDDWHAQGMAAGTPFALAHTFPQTGPFRPPNVERRRPGVFFAGSGTVPGVGLPMVFVSGKLAARRVAEYLP